MKKRYAFVTGASGGIGQALCKMLARNQYYIYLNGRNEEKLESLQKDLRELGADAEVLAFDIRDEKQLKEQITKIDTIDVLINNSGILRDNLIYSILYKDWEDVMNTNFYAVDNLYECIKDKMKRDSIVINICSISGVRPRKGQLAYAVSKRMLIQWTSIKALHQKDRKFYAISPGPINTSLIEHTKWYEDKDSLKKLPLGRYGQPDELADFIEHILTYPELYISGSNFVLDGGLLKSQ